MDERTLIDTLRKIEALHAGATTEGERNAAQFARQRILDRLKTAQEVERSEEYRFTIYDPWERRVCLALLRRYGLEPYRERGQHRQTVMVRIPVRFLNETFWPEYTALAKALDTYLSQVTDRIISEAIHGDSSEATERRALT